MSKYLFNPDGVAALGGELYRLSNVELAKEAIAIEADLVSWSKTKFDFTVEQQEFLTDINQQTIRFMSNGINYAVINRLPVILLKPEISGLRESKLIRTKSKLSSESLPDGTAIAGGEFIIEVTY